MIEFADAIRSHARDVDRMFSRLTDDDMRRFFELSALSDKNSLSDAERAEYDALNERVLPSNFDVDGIEHLISDPVVVFDRLEAAGLFPW